MAGQYYYDLGFHEGDQCRDPWRTSANVWLMRKLYTRPGNVCIPLYWLAGDLAKAENSFNEERYRNLVLASGLKATGCYCDPYEKAFPGVKGGADWVALAQYQYPVHAVTRELTASRFEDIGLAPAFWRDLGTEYEGFTLKQGSSYLLNVISHHREPREGVFALDPKRMGFAAGKPVFVWQLFAREQKDFVKTAPQPAGWERMFKEYQFSRISTDGRRLEIRLPKLMPETVRMTCITQTPAFIYSGSGEQCQLLLSDNLGCKVDGEVNETARTVALKIAANQPIAVLGYWDAAWGSPRARIAADQELNCKRTSLGGRQWALFDVGKGMHNVIVSPK
jgi:hypothetical protein